MSLHRIIFRRNIRVFLQKKVNTLQAFIFITTWTFRSWLINEGGWETNCAQITAIIAQLSRNTRRKSYIFLNSF